MTSEARNRKKRETFDPSDLKYNNRLSVRKKKCHQRKYDYMYKCRNKKVNQRKLFDGLRNISSMYKGKGGKSKLMSKCIENLISKNSAVCIGKSNIKGAGRGLFPSCNLRGLPIGFLLPIVGNISDALNDCFGNPNHARYLKVHSKYLILPYDHIPHDHVYGLMGHLVNKVLSGNQSNGIYRKRCASYNAALIHPRVSQNYLTANLRLVVPPIPFIISRHLTIYAYFEVVKFIPYTHELLGTYGTPP